MGKLWRSQRGETCTRWLAYVADYAATMGATHELAAPSNKSGRLKGLTMSQPLDAASYGNT